VKHRNGGIRWALLLERHFSPRDREGNHAPEGLWQRLAPKTLERRTHWLAAAQHAGRDARRRAATAKAQARLSSASHTSPLLSIGVAELAFP